MSAAVALAALVGAELVVRVLPPLPPTATWADVEANAKVDALRHRRQTDVVYVGSSIIDAAIDPAVVATSFPLAAGSYNAALEGADARSMISWVTGVLVPRLHPKVVVLGLTPREINDNGSNQRRFRDLFYGSRGWRQATHALTWSDRITAAAERRSMLIRERGRLRSPKNAIDYWRTGRTPAWNPPDNPRTGRLLRHDVTTPYIPPLLSAKLTVYNDFRSTDSLRALRAGIVQLQHLGIAVVVLLPARVTAAVTAVLRPDLVRAADRAIADVASATCSPTIDLRGSLGDVSSFDDGVHVKRKGALAESAMVGRALDALAGQGRLRPGC